MIGPVVRRFRLERKLSQEALAALADVSSGYLSKLERGLYKSPSLNVMSRIASALGMPAAELYKAAGLEHLVIESDPSLEPLLEGFAPRLKDLPRRDREIMGAELRRILVEERKEEK